MLGYLKIVDFLNVFAALEEDDAELNYSVIDSEHDLTLLATVSSFMWRSLNRVNGYFEATIPAYLSGEFKSHFRMTRQTCESVGSGDHAHRTHSNWEHIWAAYDSAGEANTAVPMECSK